MNKKEKEKGNNISRQQLSQTREKQHDLGFKKIDQIQNDFLKSLQKTS